MVAFWFTVTMPASGIIRLLFLVVSVYFIITLFWGKYNLFRDPFHPYAAYRSVLLLSMVFQIPIHATSRTGFSEETYIFILLTVLFFGLFSDAAAFLMSRYMPIRDSLSLGPSRSVATYFFLIYLLGWLWRSYALSAGLLYGTFLATKLEVTTYSNFLGQLNQLSLVSLFGYSVFSDIRRSTRLVHLMALGEVVWMMIAGSKAAIIYVVLPLLLIYFHRRSFRINGRFLFAILILVVAVFVTFSYMQNYRLQVQRLYSQRGHFSFDLLVDATNITTESGVSVMDVGDNAVTTLMKRLDWAGFYGKLLERPDLLQDKWYGKSYLPIFFWWIPRFAWPNKPAVSVGAWYGREVLGWSFDSRSEGAITLWGDAAMNFGMLGVITISLAWVLFTFLFYHLGLRSGEWGLLFLASVYVRLLLGLEQNAAAPLVSVQQTALVIGSLYAGARLFTLLYKRALV